MGDVIRLGGTPEKKKWASVGSQLARLEKMPMPIRVLASPKLTAVLGTTLGALMTGGGLPAVFPAIKGGLWTLGGVATAEGLIQTSPRVEEFAKRKLRPEKVGKYLGEQIESFGKEKAGSDQLTFKEKVKEGLKKAGLIGGALAGAGALAYGVTKAVPYVKKKLAERKKAEVGLVSKDVARPYPTLEQPYLPSALVGYPQISPTGAPQQQLTRPPIQNIIQIQVEH